ncbi:MAG TPA: hypothetical protein VMU80_10515 [Bryobacteraceae bacterium]|nr:hypothetical protein [Bryobacteraceae bacterium]HUO29642.1 hypothetical protein [Bryobacteraceae bacterium]
MRHVFVETNWVYDRAAPAHHKGLAAVDLLRRAQAGEIKLHLPALCLAEARQAILTKCQPRHEADAIRQFLRRARPEKTLSEEQDRVTREVLDRFEQQVRNELKELSKTLDALHREPSLEVFALNDKMLETAVDLSSFDDLSLKPFDQAILAGVLVRAGELRDVGELDLCFCEVDSDLQPWDKHGHVKWLMTELYANFGVWVYGDFEMRSPERPKNWPG